jgi:hypothetical protein
VHVAAGHVGNRLTENDWTRAIRLGKNRSATGCGIDLIFFPVGVQVEAAQSAKYPLQTLKA